MRHKRYYFKGEFIDANEMSTILGITRQALYNRISKGWKLINDEFISPYRLRKECWRKDRLITIEEGRLMRSSFIGESVCLI